MQTSAHHSGPMKPTTRAKADELRKAGRLDDAVSEYSQLWPDEDPWTGWGYAYCLRKLGRSKEALAVAREVHALDPEFVLGRSVYAWSLYDVHIRGVEAPEPEVLKAAQMIVRLVGSGDKAYAPTSALVITVLKVAKAWASRTRDIRALEWLEKLDPTRLSTEPRRGRDERGRELELSSPREQYFAIRTHALERLGRWQACLEITSTAMSECGRLHHDNDIWFARRIALAKQHLGRPQEALSDLRELAARKPTGFMQTDIARAAWQAGDVDSTYQHSLLALLTPDEMGFKLEAVRLMAEVLWRRGDLELARVHICLCLAVRDSKGWKADEDLMRLASSWDVSGPRRDPHAIVGELQPLWRQWRDDLTPKRTGTIVKILAHGHAGFIRANDGEQFYFETRDWKQGGAQPVEGAHVSFTTRPSFDRKRQRPTVVACEVRPGTVAH